MKIEHIALQVKDPAAMAEWYCTHLGFQIKYKADQPIVNRFIADSAGNVMLELYRTPKFRIPDYSSLEPALLHVAFMCEDVEETHKLLTEAGASPEGEIVNTGDVVITFLRDPWGLTLQLCKRNKPLL